MGAFVVVRVGAGRRLEAAELGVEGHERAWDEVALGGMYCHVADWKVGHTVATAVDLEGSGTAGMVRRIALALGQEVAGLNSADTALHGEGALPKQASNDSNCSVAEAGSSVSRQTVVLNHFLVVISWHSQHQAEVAAEHHIYFSVERRESLYLMDHLRAVSAAGAEERVLGYMRFEHLGAAEDSKAWAQAGFLKIAVVRACSCTVALP